MGTPAGSALHQDLVFALDHFESADSAADIHAGPLGIGFADLQTSAIHREIARGNRKLDEATHLFYVFFFDVGRADRNSSPRRQCGS